RRARRGRRGGRTPGRRGRHRQPPPNRTGSGRPSARSDTPRPDGVGRKSVGMSALLLLGLVTAAAPSLTVDVTGKCPSAEAVAVAVGSAVGKWTARTGKDFPQA